MKKQRTQWKDVLNYMNEHGSISSMEAWDKFHITRLSAVIWTLRKRGYNISTTDKDGYNEYGRYTYGEYRLEAKPNGIN